MSSGRGLGRRAPVLALAVLAGAWPAGGAIAQSPAVVEGQVRDAATGEALPGVDVALEGAAERRSVLTDEAGAYVLPVPPGIRFSVRVQRMGYRGLVLEMRDVRGRARVDFRLAATPLPLPPLRVWGDAARRGGVAPAAAPGGAPADRALAEVHARSAAPLGGTLLVPVARPAPTQGGSAPPGASGGPAGLAVRGLVSRRGATYLGEAPAQLGPPPSPVGPSFPEGGVRPVVFEGGAPARVTGGLEHVVEVPPPRAPSESSADARLDAVRADARLRWRAGRFAAQADAGGATPWAPDVVGESGWGAATAHLRGWADPAEGHHLRAGASFRDESVPAGRAEVAGSGAPLRSREATASLLWEADLAPGRLTLRVGSGAFRADLPAGAPPPDARTSRLARDQSHVSLELRRALGGGFAVAAGADRLTQAWRSRSPSSVAYPDGGRWSAGAAVSAAFGEVGWTGERLGLRGGLRLEHVDGRDGASLSPRLRLDWRVSSSLGVTLGSGVHRQLLPVDEPAAFAGRVPVLLGRGVHHTAGAAWSADRWDAALELHYKRLEADARAEVAGGTLALSGALPASGEAALTARLERRSAGRSRGWSAAASAWLRQPLPWALRLEAGATFSDGAGGLLLPLAGPDSVVGGGAPAADHLAASSGASLGLDLHLERSVDLERVRATPYLRAQNVLGREERWVFVTPAEGAPPPLPRVLSAGVAVRWGGGGDGPP